MDGWDRQNPDFHQSRLSFPVLHEVWSDPDVKLLYNLTIN